MDQQTVDCSNRIHDRLKATTRRQPDILARLAALPLFARYAVGATTVGVVHGDADALAGWMFDAAEMDKPEQQHRISGMFGESQVDVFAPIPVCQRYAALSSRRAAMES